ncbi:MAG: TrkA family potassium uptake protein [Candidatus Cloacimonetes bacterium]|nr:TrkA family potassium uptake protein [Candidatus Cloacimonadota bacterium]
MYIIIAGAGVIGSQIARKLIENKYDVVVIDKDEEVCESIYTDTGAMTIHGNATRMRTLKDAGADKADVLLCLMNNDADNISCGLLAKSLGVEEIISRLRRPQYKNAYQIADIELIDVSRLVVHRMMEQVEKPKVKRLFTIEDGKAEVYAININEDSQAVGMKIKEITSRKKFPVECNFMGIYKKEQEKADFYFPRGNYIIRKNDTVFLVTNSQFIKQASDFLTKKKKKFGKK